MKTKHSRHNENSEVFTAVSLLKSLKKNDKKIILFTSSLEKESFLTKNFERLAKSIQAMEKNVIICSCDENDLNNPNIKAVDAKKSNPFSDIKRENDQIIFVKGPPLTLSSESFMICEHCDGVILMEEYRHSSYKNFEKCLFMIESIDVPVLGIVPCH